MANGYYCCMDYKIIINLILYNMHLTYIILYFQVIDIICFIDAKVTTDGHAINCPPMHALLHNNYDISK